MRPEYLLWVASVPPNTAPSYLVRTLRQYTSQRAFASFHDLGQENPSGDFWAPGYLIIGGPQPPHAQVIKEYIERTRHLQGARLPDPNIGT